MGTRGRNTQDPDTSDTRGPFDDPIGRWVWEMTEAMSTFGGRVLAVENRQAAVEKSTDALAAEVRSSAAVAQTATAVLERIAKAEEERVEAEKDRNKILRDQGKYRDKWAEKVWASQPFQLLLTGVVLAVLQFLGLSYIVSQMPGAPNGTGP